MALFYSRRTACADCHGGPAFSGSLRAVGHEAAAARFAATGVAPGKFKVPGLRNVALTAPYMHDGSLPTLRAVIDFYDRGGGGAALKRLGLSAREKGDLVAFLESLTDPR
jgi:cytochrome c peroxidase